VTAAEGIHSIIITIIIIITIVIAVSINSRDLWRKKISASASHF
jgi:hypothetical protein